MELLVNFHVALRLLGLRVPQELIKMNFKLMQKLIEKQKLVMLAEVKKIQASKSAPAIKAALVKKLVASFEQFQRRLRVLLDKDREYHARLSARKEHMAELAQWAKPNDDGTDLILDMHQPGLLSWYRQENMALVVDYLIKSNVPKLEKEPCDDAMVVDDPPEAEKAQNMAIKNGTNGTKNGNKITQSENLGLRLLDRVSTTYPRLPQLLDHEVFANFNRIFVLIAQDHDLSLVELWFTEHRGFLKKNHSNLEFEINYCKFLLLIDEGLVRDAIEFSQNHLLVYLNFDNYEPGATTVYEANIAKLKQIGGLLLYLAVDGGRGAPLVLAAKLALMPRFRHYQTLLSDERWELLSQCFTTNFNQLYGIPNHFPLYIYLLAGLASLKTKLCYRNDENTIFGTPELLAALEIMEPVQPIESTSEARPQTPASSPIPPNVFAALLAPIGWGYFNLVAPGLSTSIPPPRTLRQHTPPSQYINDPRLDKRIRGPNRYYKLLERINHCPVCLPELFQLARALPYAQLITNIFNNPFMLPNGNIYPFEKLVAPLDQHLNEKSTLLRKECIKDPLTQQVFSINDCIRVYPA